MSEFLSSCACFSSEISSFFVIAAVRPKIAINSFFQILRVDQRICETTRVFSLMSKRELRQLHVMGQIMLLSFVTSHELSMSVPLVGRLTLFGEASRWCLACVVPGSCGPVASIFLVGPAGFPSPFLRPFLFLPGGGGLIRPSLSQGMIILPSLSRGRLLVLLPILDELHASP